MKLHSIFKYSFLGRIAATPLLYYTRNSIPYTVLLLVLLDIIDCNPLFMKLIHKEDSERFCNSNHHYVLLDKLVNIFQYCIAIYFLSPQLPPNVIHILLGFTLMRLVGLFKFSFDKNPVAFVIFFDFIKEYLLLFYIYYPNFTMWLLIETMIVKVIFEYYMHKRRIFSTLYELLFD
jgi:hypothetical protein